MAGRVRQGLAEYTIAWGRAATARAVALCRPDVAGDGFDPYIPTADAVGFSSVAPSGLMRESWNARQVPGASPLACLRRGPRAGASGSDRGYPFRRKCHGVRS